MIWHDSCYVKGKRNEITSIINHKEDTINTNITTATETSADIGYETSKFAVNVGIGAAALIGIWGVACLIGGLVANGAGGLLAGYLSAITGM